MAPFPPISRTNYFPNHGNLFNLLLQTNPDDNQLRFMGWENLKQRAPIGLLNIPEMMQQVEQQFLNNKEPLVDNAHQLFARFTELLRSEIRITQLPGEVFQVTEADLITLQARLPKHYEDEALQIIWNQSLVGIFNQQGAFLHVARPNGVQEIRAWLNDPANIERIQQVTHLNFSYSGLKVLPSEIGLFTGLHQLSLSNNQLSYLPDSFGNLRALTELYLSNNRLSYLPDSFGNLQALRWLYLSNNRLSYLPDSFGNLQALNQLHLYNNQLSYLPESLGDLQALTWLDLYNNRLSYLPESLGKLQALNQLHLDNNQLSYLPDSFSNLRALNSVSLDHNPLMLVSDKERDKIKSCRTYLDLLEPLKKYTPQSPLATLFHAIIFNKSAETIQQAYAQLSPEMQQRIAELANPDPNSSGSAQSTAASSSAASSSSGPSPSQDSLFTDMGLFARSVRKATYALYDSLGLDQKNLVHYHIWDLAGRPETDDPQWGEHHAFDDVLRFVDALERATIY